MTNKRKKIIICSIIAFIFLIATLTVAYYRRNVIGNITGYAGDIVLIVNEQNSKQIETFTIPLNTDTDDVAPGDSGSFDINIDLTGSSTHVGLTVEMLRTNLPDNLKFYLDEEFTVELTSKNYKIKKSDSMTKEITIYWYWDGTIDDENDMLFINSSVEATIVVSAINIQSVTGTFIETLLTVPSTLDTDVNFAAPSSDENGIGLMKRSGTENDEFPIVYYRGDVTDNNVIFANYCWLIVRTTETGGVKLLYNGEVNNDGSCNNYRLMDQEIDFYQGAFISDATINTILNDSMSLPLYAGYMLNDDVNMVIDWIGKYGDSVSAIINGYSDHLLDNTIDATTNRHVQNLKDSNIKTIIDSWYKTNIFNTGNSGFLEDTIWCNDRSISTMLPLESYEENNGFAYGAVDRLYSNSIDLLCSREVDRFTVDRNNGNGDLTYPIGMLTSDEAAMAGAPLAETEDLKISYITVYAETIYLTMTPAMFSDEGLMFFAVSPLGLYFGNQYVRPAISLSSEVDILDGNGSFAKPYIVGLKLY